MLQNWMQENFQWIQLGLAIFFLTAAWMFLRPKRESRFRYRESDRQPHSPFHGDALAKAKMKRRRPLALAGISLDGEPHEILGVKANASVEEIQKAHREMLKVYHPDKIGPQGSREWKDAQRIASALNEAKEKLLKARNQKEKQH